MDSDSNNDTDDGSQRSDSDDWRQNAREKLNKYLPLYKASLEGNWEKAKDFFDNVDKKAVAARITFSSETALHVAAGAGHLMFTKNLMKLLKPKQLEIKNKEGETAVQNAVIAGKIEAVKAMVQKNPKLTQMTDSYGWIPLVNAAKYASLEEQKREMIGYLYATTREHDVNNRPSSFSGNLGAQIICSIIGAGYHVPCIKQLYRKKLMNEEAVALVKCICKKIISSMSSAEVEEYFKRTNILGTATKYGTVELVTECFEKFPDIVWVRMGDEGHNVFMSAVQERQENLAEGITYLSECLPDKCYRFSMITILN